MKRKMNEIENMFYNAYQSIDTDDEEFSLMLLGLEPQVRIGIYVVDFMYGDSVVVEIDGHESHKTKEQREKDYVKSRYLMKRGFQVIRFMGTEVFLAADECVLEMIEIGEKIEFRDIENFHLGMDSGEKKVLKEWQSYNEKMDISK